MVDILHSFTVKIWHGGKFKSTGVGLEYSGGEFQTVSVDPDLISWFDLDELVVTNVGIEYDHTLYYSLHNSSTFEEGLRRVNSDASVMEMATIGTKMRVVELYVVNELDDLQLFRDLNVCAREKLTPRRAPKMDSNDIDDHGCEANSLLGESEHSEIENSGDDSEDDSYVASEDYGSEDESLVLSEDIDDVAENAITINEVENTLSEYENSEGEDANNKQFDENTDFRTFKWSVGLRFASANAFRDALVKYALIQGRNVKISKSDKLRQQRLGVVCIPGCPFKIYASWDRATASFVVKTLVPQHTCQRSMDGNRQLRSCWVADQMLDVFKGRPHIPSAEIVDLVRENYKVMISKDIAYNIKYIAHRKLHGSMKEQYNKVMDYYEALRGSCSKSHFTVVSVPDSTPATFQRFFVLFDGLRCGWIKGCRKVLCIDGCFIKTFLGGMLLSAIGRDPNEQMFPLAWD